MLKMGVVTHPCNLNICVAGEKGLEAEASRRTSKEASSQREMKPSPTWGLTKEMQYAQGGCRETLDALPWLGFIQRTEHA